MNKQSVTYTEVEKFIVKLRDISLEYWMNNVFLTWRWWVLIGLLIIPWLIWLKIVDKNRRQELLVYGFSISILGLTMDTVGNNLLLWGYPYQIVNGILPPLLPANLGVLPVTFMLIYYFFPTFKRFFITNVVVAACLSFIGQPIFKWLGFYVLTNWNYVYSFLVYIVMFLICYCIVRSTKPQKVNKKDRYSN